MSVWSRSIGLLAGVAALIAVSGCGQTKPAAGGPTISESVSASDAVLRHGFSFDWLQSQALNLMSPLGTFVRATLESDIRVAFARNLSAAAPGFEGTFSAGFGAEQYALREYASPTPVTGTIAIRVLDVQERGPSFRVPFCVYYGGAYELDSVGMPTKLVRKQGHDPFGDAVVVEKKGSILPLARQHGSRVVPVSNVFGSWKTVRFESGLDNGEPCDERLEKFERLPNTLPLSAVPERVNSPGWPSR